MDKKRKIIVICGPTATGKTELGIKLAKEFNGEIVSADSRQVYKYMDIGTGKDIDKYNGIKVWCLDIVEPDYQFNVGEYKILAEKAIENILERGKLPIIVGGTGLYIKALTNKLPLLTIPINNRLREELRYQSIKVLREKLLILNKEKFLSMNNSDQNNPRRLIRAIEIVNYLNSYSPSVIARSEATKQSSTSTKKIATPRNIFLSEKVYVARNDNFEQVLLIGLSAPKEILNKRVEVRIKKRVKQGIINEIRTLLQKGYTWNLPAMSGLGYRQFQPYFAKTASLEEVIQKWQQEEINYYKRQMTWFKKIPDINWFDITKKDFYTDVINLICRF